MVYTWDSKQLRGNLFGLFIYVYVYGYIYIWLRCVELRDEVSPSPCKLALWHVLSHLETHDPRSGCQIDHRTNAHRDPPNQRPIATVLLVCALNPPAASFAQTFFQLPGGSKRSCQMVGGRTAPCEGTLQILISIHSCTT